MKTEKINDKEKRQRRIQQKENHINRQLSLTKTFNQTDGFEHRYLKEPGRLAKKTWRDCGNPNCFMCGNPRKFFGEITYQEMKHLDVEKSFSEDVFSMPDWLYNELIQTEEFKNDTFPEAQDCKRSEEDKRENLL